MASETKAERMPGGDNRLDCESALALLSGDQLGLQERRRVVLAAEVLPFRDDQASELCDHLMEFVLQFRDSNEAEDLVAVSSAIRKLVAYLPAERLGDLAELIDSSHRLPVPLEIELEVTKTIARKLSVEPPNIDDSEPILGDRLFDITSTYLNPRLLSREKYGATALNAALSLLLLRSRHAQDLIQLVQNARTSWFTELLQRRLARLLDDLQQGTEADRHSALVRFLAARLNDLAGQ
jgi:hypothetical protein